MKSGNSFLDLGIILRRCKNFFTMGSCGMEFIQGSTHIEGFIHIRCLFQQEFQQGGIQFLIRFKGFDGCFQEVKLSIWMALHRFFQAVFTSS